MEVLILQALTRHAYSVLHPPWAQGVGRSNRPAPTNFFTLPFGERLQQPWGDVRSQPRVPAPGHRAAFGLVPSSSVSRLGNRTSRQTPTGSDRGAAATHVHQSLEPERWSPAPGYLHHRPRRPPPSNWL